MVRVFSEEEEKEPLLHEEIEKQPVFKVYYNHEE